MGKVCKICGEELFYQENHFRETKTLEVVCINCFEKNPEMDVFSCTVTPTKEWGGF